MTGKHARRLGGFMLLPAISMISPLLALPAITSHFGAAGWSSVAVAQSIGTAAIVFAELGWALTGPQTVASMDHQDQCITLFTSMVTRAIVFPAVAIVSVATTAMLTPQYTTVAVLTALGTCANGLTSNWFFIGCGSPLRILLSDTIPRLGWTALAIVVITAGGPFWVYPASLITANISSVCFGLVLARPTRQTFKLLGWAVYCRVATSQWTAVRGRAASALYLALPISLVSVAAPASLATFSVLERLMRMILGVLQSIPNALQSWIGQARHDTKLLGIRVRKAVLWNCATGVLSAAGFALLYAVMVEVLFSGIVKIHSIDALLAGTVILITCVSRSTGGLGLIAFGRIKALSNSALLGASLGIPSILILAHVRGTTGAYIGELIAEVGVLGVQSRILLKEIRLVSSPVPHLSALTTQNGAAS